MAEKASSSRETETRAKPRVSSEVKLALIEHALRPLAIALVGCLVVLWLWPVRERLEYLKYGPVEAKLRARAEKQDVEKTLDSLKGLTNEQLQLFLIIGKDRKGEFINYSGSEVNAQNLAALEQVGLLASADSEQRPDGTINYTWGASEKAYKLHQIIFDLLVESIRSLEDS